MRTILKKQLQELRQEMPIIDKEELMTFVGGDRYYFDTSGNFMRVADSNENKVYAGNDTVGINIDNVTEIEAYIDNSSNLSGVSISGAKYELFEYLAKNTDYEWALSYNGSGDKPEGFMNTNFQEDTINPLYKEGFDSIIHSHPNNGDPSPQDEEVKSGLIYRGEYDYKYFAVYKPDEIIDNYVPY